MIEVIAKPCVPLTDKIKSYSEPDCNVDPLMTKLNVYCPGAEYSLLKDGIEAIVAMSMDLSPILHTAVAVDVT